MRKRHRPGSKGGWSLVLALGAVNAACGGYRPDPGPRSAPSLEPTAVEGTPLTHLWTAGGPRAISAPVVVVDSTLFVAGSGRQVAKIDLRGGAVIWSQRLGGPVAGGVIYSHDRVYLATDQPEGRVRAFTALAGNDLWSVSTGPVSAPLAYVNDLVIARNRAGMTIALDATTGAQKWRVRTSAGPAPALAGLPGQLIVPALDSLFLLDLATGRALVRMPSPGPLLFPLIADDSTVIGVSADGIIFALRKSDLQPSWRIASHAIPAGPALLRGDTLEFVSTTGHFYRVGIGTAELPVAIGDSSAPVTAGPGPMDDLLLIGGADGVVSARDATGAERWRVQIKRPIEVTPLSIPGGLILIGGEGDIHRFSR